MAGGLRGFIASSVQTPFKPVLPTFPHPFGLSLSKPGHGIIKNHSCQRLIHVPYRPFLFKNPSPQPSELRLPKPAHRTRSHTLLARWG